MRSSRNVEVCAGARRFVLVLYRSRRAAGYLEGVLTAVRIHEHYDNLYAWLMGQFPGESTLPQIYIDWMTEQDEWVVWRCPADAFV